MTPTVISSGAVSPMMRAIASMMPVPMPAIAVRQHDLDDVSHCGTPSASEASRSSFGTSLSISSRGAHDDRDHQHRQRDGADDAQPDAGPRNTANSAQANRPATIDGMPVMTSTKNVTPRLSRPRAVLHQVDGGQQADRHRDERGAARDDERADDRVVDAAALADDAAIEWVRK